MYRRSLRLRRRRRSFLIAGIAILLVVATWAWMRGGGLGGIVVRGSVPYLFADVTEEVGLPTEPTRTWGSAWGDFDGSGYPNLFVGHHWDEPGLYKNLSGAYERFEGAGDFRPTKVDRHACAWGEANGDGRPDLYCVQAAHAHRQQAPNQLFIQTARGFEDRARRMGVRNASGRGRTVQWLDYDVDGRIDLFVGNKSPKSSPNVMFRQTDNGFEKASVGVGRPLSTIGSSVADWTLNGYPDLLIFQEDDHAVAYENRKGRFRSVALEGITNREWVSGAWGDYDGDGWPDLHLVNETSAVVMKNVRGGFQEVHRMRLNHGRMSVWFDVDNDGDLDIYVIQGAPGKRREDPIRGALNHQNFLLVRENGTFDRVDHESHRGPPTGNSDGVSAADHNRDGKMDLLVTNGHLRSEERVTLLENRSNVGNWAAIDFVGDSSNPWGMGASVQVKTSRSEYRRRVSDGFNYRTQSEVGYMVLGLGDSSAAEVHVRWPDETRDCLTVSKSERLRLVKGSEPCEDA